MSETTDPPIEDSDKGSIQEMDPQTRFRIRFLLASILLVALCSITYELIIGTVSSYLLGNSVYQFSLTIGLYMSAMGVGSYLSKFIEERLLERFFWVELGVGILGGTCSALLFGVFAIDADYFEPLMWVLTLSIGVLVGLEIPLLTRHIRNYAQLRVALANVLSWDYIGSLVGSLAFPLLLLPTLGLLNSAAIIGMINIAVAAAGLYAFRDELERKRRLILGAVLSFVVLAGLFASSNTYDKYLDKRLFQDPVVYSEQTRYQKLTLTAWRSRDYRLFINGNIQFSSMDEYRYHEALTHLPMSLVPDVKNVLILGGGDGLVVRQLKKWPKVEAITMVDLDPRMTALAQKHPLLRRLNEDAMDDPRLKVVNDDAMNFLMNTKIAYDVILIDLPDPNNESLSKLYSNAFYRLVRNRLSDDGVMVTQSTSTYFAPNAFWSIHRTIEDAFCPNDGVCARDAQHVIPYHVWVPSFSDWGFNLASKKPLRPTEWKIKVPTKFFDDQVLGASLVFPRDIAERDVKINRLTTPVLLTYYLSDWHSYNN